MIWNMAWRNIWRNKRRTVLCIGAMAFSIAVLIILLAFMNGTNQLIIESSISTYTGYVNVNRKGYWGNESLDGYIQKPAAIISEIEKLPHVKAVTSRISSGALLSKGDVSIGCLLVGIDPEKEPKVTIFYRGIKQGRFLQAKDRYQSPGLKIDEIYNPLVLATKLQEGLDPLSRYLKLHLAPNTREALDKYDSVSDPSDKLQRGILNDLNYLMQREFLYDKERFAQVSLNEYTLKLAQGELQGEERFRLNRMLLEQAYPRGIGKIYPMIIGVDMAKRLSVSLDDRITLVASNLNGSMEAAIFQIIGIFNAGNPEFNRNVAMVTDCVAANILGYGNDKVSQIVVNLDYEKNLNKTIAAINGMIKKYKAFYRKSSQSSDLLAVDDLQDPAGLADKLYYGLNPFSIYLRESFSRELKMALASYDGLGMPSEAMTKSMVNELNRLMQAGSLYEKNRFADIELDKETLSMAKKRLTGPELITLNRRLLEAAYPDEIAGRFHALAIEIDEGLGDEYVQPESGIEIEGNFEVLSWRRILADIVQYIKLQNGFIGLIAGVIFLAVFIIVLNVSMMSVMERTREFGILKAMGMNLRKIRRLVFLESLMLGTTAWVVGCLVGIGISLWLYFAPIPIDTFISVFKTGMLQPKITAILDAPSIVAPVVMVIVISLLATVYPMWKVSKMTVVEAIHST